MSASLALVQSLTAGFAILATLWLLAGIIFTAHRSPFYSHLRQTISELGAHGLKQSRAVSWLVFFPVGILVWLFCFTFFFASGTSPAVAEAMWLFALVGAGYVGAAIFPCDYGAPMLGSWRNNIHVAFGIAEYIGGIAGLYLLEQWLQARGASTDALMMRVLAFAVIVPVILMAQAWLKQWRGVLQRVAESALFGGMLYCGIVLA